MFIDLIFYLYIYKYLINNFNTEIHVTRIIEIHTHTHTILEIHITHTYEFCQ